jgi:hypothetical protein
MKLHAGFIWHRKRTEAYPHVLFNIGIVIKEMYCCFYYVDILTPTAYLAFTSLEDRVSVCSSSHIRTHVTVPCSKRCRLKDKDITLYAALTLKGGKEITIRKE